ncbi:MAG: hypothetical protein ACRC6B_05685 [Fusobacteriaceae bacterium]
MAKLLTSIIKGTLSVSTDGSNKIGCIYADGFYITNLNWANISNKTNVLAGMGLTGGGSLNSDITLNIETSSDGITIGDDGILLNTINTLDQTSTTRALSAAQGKLLNDNKVEKTTIITGSNGIIVNGSSTTNLVGNLEILHPASVSNSAPSNDGKVINGLSFVDGHISKIDVFDLDQRYYTETEVDGFFSDLVTGMDWKESVNTESDIIPTYGPGIPGIPTQDGWTVNVKDTDVTYRFDGTNWIQISANIIPMASDALDGKMSKEDFTKLRKIQTVGSTNQWLRWDSDNTAKWTTLPQSSTVLSGIVKLNDTFLSASNTEAATANTVKILKEELKALSDGLGGASAFVRKAGDEMAGKLTFSSVLDLGIYHENGTSSMIRRGSAANATTVGNTSAFTLIESSTNPRTKVGSTTYDIFHMGRKPNLASGETIGVLPIIQGGTGQSAFRAPTNGDSGDGFMRFDGTKFETVRITFDNIGGGTGGEGGGGSEILDDVYLRLDGFKSMTGSLKAPSAVISTEVSIGGVRLVRNDAERSLDFVF